MYMYAVNVIVIAYDLNKNSCIMMLSKSFFLSCFIKNLFLSCFNLLTCEPVFLLFHIGYIENSKLCFLDMKIMSRRNGVD